MLQSYSKTLICIPQSWGPCRPESASESSLQVRGCQRQAGALEGQLWEAPSPRSPPVPRGTRVLGGVCVATLGDIFSN